MPILDSDFLIGILRGNEEAAGTLRILEGGGQLLGTTVINIYELLLGAELHSNPDEKRHQAEALLSSLVIYSLTPSASSIAASISSKLVKAGNMIDFQDIAIGAITIANSEILYTRNSRHFSRIEGLSTKKW